jgi:serine/threonine protein kinase/formylglycine-generating enzyme required for sulfatase activity
MERTEWAPESLSPAEQVLIDYLAEHGRAGKEDFERLCAERPELAAELRRLHAEWSRLDRVLGGRGDTGSSLAARFAAAGAHEDPRFFDDFIDRLARHRSAEPRYRVDEKIGGGGMGHIHKAWDADLRRHVAMKVLRKTPAKSAARQPYAEERTLGRFLEEAQITGQLEHPGIIPVHELGVDADGRIYYTMPLVRGRDLKEVFELARARREGWNPTRALGVLLKVCEAVAYAHAKGVIHRDIKPSNVMVGRFGETYVMDWGLARVMGEPDTRDLRIRPFDGTQSTIIDTDVREKLESTPHSPLVTLDGAVLGTPAYMPPEQAQGRIESLSARSDVYSIGALLYQLLTGQMPYVKSGTTASPQTVLAARLLGPPEPVLAVAPDAPPELAAVCEKAMASNPERRYKSALDLAADVEAYLAHRPVSAFESSPRYLLKLAYRRHRALANLAAAALAATAAWAAWDVLSTRRALARETELRASVQVSADRDAARVLALTERDLFPAAQRTVPAMDAWLARADDVLSRADGYRGDARFADLAASLGDLAELRASVAARRERAATLEDRTVVRHREHWNEAIASIASLPTYGGLALAPQPGLVPLQLNPTSGLWEFWVDGTGTRPELADASTGALARDPESALVLVLVPGGPATIGSPPTERDRIDNETQVTLDLAPYFIAKTEVTQALWLRTMGDYPAHFGPRVKPLQGADWRLLPVESIDWHESAEFLRRVDLAFPTEAQWERAARAGTSGAYGASDDVASLSASENLVDASLPAAPYSPRLPWSDGYPYVSPIASFAPNGFGLYDVLGNVSEWCADGYVVARASEGLRPGDGLALAEDSPFRVFRGGNHYAAPSYDRIAFRNWTQPRNMNQVRGLRPARDVR